MGLVEQFIAMGPREREGRSAARSETATDRSTAESPIVVRIGRLDVRAVHAPAAPRPDPGPRRPTGPTLEERLAARERQ
jgi:hypothetical protein